MRMSGSELVQPQKYKFTSSPRHLLDCRSLRWTAVSWNQELLWERRYTPGSCKSVRDIACPSPFFTTSTLPLKVQGVRCTKDATAQGFNAHGQDRDWQQQEERGCKAAHRCLPRETSCGSGSKQETLACQRNRQAINNSTSDCDSNPADN